MKVNFFYTNELCPLLQFIKKSHSFNKAATIESADYIIYEDILQNKGKKGNQDLKMISKLYPPTKKVIIFIIDDYEKRYCYYTNLILLRTSLRSSLKRKNEFVLPYIWDHKKESFPVSHSSPLATVGFCGVVSKHRKKIIRVFEKNNQLKCDFVKQEAFWGGNPHDPTVIKVFYSNIENNQYIICNRGRGNFSMRFYETLATGRVPVLVNTNIELPFSHIINWEDAIIMKNRERDCAIAVIENHAVNGFVAKQKNAIAIFQQYFTQENFFDEFVKQLIIT
jgi:hypothetical protein